MSNSVLIAEDDDKLAMQIERFLGQYGFQLQRVADGLEAIRVCQTLQPDILILDLMLPGADGFEVCRQVRQNFQGSILMLTASEDDMDHVAGIESGADDYLIKPVHPRVLLAHIRLLLRKQQAYDAGLKTEEKTETDECRESRWQHFGKLSIHPLQRRVELNDNEVELTPSEFDILRLLVQHSEQVVSRETIFQALRGIEYDGLDRSVDVKVVALRKKLGDNTSRPRKIITVRGKGYLFVEDAWG